MARKTANATERRLQRDAIRELTLARWTAEDLALLLGVSVRQVEAERALLRETECRLRLVGEVRAELAGRLAVNG